MTVNVIVQARMGSKRLPGKVMRTVDGRPMIDIMLERLQQCELATHVIVAMPEEDRGGVLDTWVQKRWHDRAFGPMDNVAARFEKALWQYPCDAFVRICADSPLIDPGLVDLAISIFQSDPTLDLVTNTTPRTFPAGQCVELVKTTTFATHTPRFTTDYQREHVTPYFYEHGDQFRGEVFGMTPDMSDVRMVVDTAEDFDNFARAVSGHDNLESMRWQSFLRR